jgi:hypothetical protein
MTSGTLIAPPGSATAWPPIGSRLMSTTREGVINTREPKWD